MTTNTSGGITIGTDDLNFAQFSGAGQITAGTGLTKSGNTISLDTNITVAGTLDVTSTTNLNDTTDSTNDSSGALIVDGGVGIKKRLNVTGNTTLGGKLITTPQELTVGNDGNINSGTAILLQNLLLILQKMVQEQLMVLILVLYQVICKSAGEVIHLFYDNSSATALQIDFGSGNLLSATGLINI